MGTTGSLPATNIYSTWSESIEVFSADDDTLYDFSGVTEIKLILQDTYSRIDEVILTMSNGDITLPAPGIIQWRAEVGQMGTLPGKTYRAILLIYDDSDTAATLMMGPLTVIE